MKKDFLKGFFSAVLIIGIIAAVQPVFADSELLNNILNEIKIVLNDYELEDTGFLYNGKVYAPMDEIAGRLNMELETDTEQGIVNIREHWYYPLSERITGYEEITPDTFDLLNDGEYRVFPGVPGLENYAEAVFSGGTIYEAYNHGYRYETSDPAEAFNSYLRGLEELGFQSKGFYSIYTDYITLIKGDLQVEVLYDLAEDPEEIWVYVVKMNEAETTLYPTKRFYNEWQMIPSFSYFAGVPCEYENRWQLADGRCYYTYNYDDFMYLKLFTYCSALEEMGFKATLMNEDIIMFQKEDTFVNINFYEEEVSISGNVIESLGFAYFDKPFSAGRFTQ